jgi:hypothetical protein
MLIIERLPGQPTQRNINIWQNMVLRVASLRCGVAVSGIDLVPYLQGWIGSVGANQSSEVPARDPTVSLLERAGIRRHSRGADATDTGGALVSAMCRKCLRSTSDEARRCTVCGGRIVRFNDLGEAVEIESSMDDPAEAKAIPPLFGDFETQVAASPANSHSPAMPSGAGMGMGIAPMGTVAPQSGNGHAGGNGALAGISAPPAATGRALHNAYDGPGTSSPLPIGGYDGTNVQYPGVVPVMAPGALILPAAEVDDVVTEMLTPFGFEMKTNKQTEQAAYATNPTGPEHAQTLSGASPRAAVPPPAVPAVPSVPTPTQVAAAAAPAIPIAATPIPSPAPPQAQLQPQPNQVPDTDADTESEPPAFLADAPLGAMMSSPTPSSFAPPVGYSPTTVTTYASLSPTPMQSSTDSAQRSPEVALPGVALPGSATSLSPAPETSPISNQTAPPSVSPALSPLSPPSGIALPPSLPSVPTALPVPATALSPATDPPVHAPAPAPPASVVSTPEPMLESTTATAGHHPFEPARAPSAVARAAPAPTAGAPTHESGTSTADADVSFAELAREIISIAEEEDPPGEEGHEEKGADQKAASFDLMIGPAVRHGRLRRSKPAISKERFLEADGLVPNGQFGPGSESLSGASEHSDVNGQDGSAEHGDSGRDKGRSRSRLRHR